MRQQPILVTVVWLCLCFRIAHADVLTIGSPAPELTSAKVVQGTTVSKLERGHKYVIEFSGTNCAPCIRSIPLIEELKNKHKQFTFVSVFSEDEDDVRAFLDGAGRGMSTHIACDSSGAIFRNWMLQADIRGIPFVFVVNEDGNIAWMGSPDGLTTALSILAKQKTLTPEVLMRATLLQHASLRQMHADERSDEAQRYRRETIIRLVNEGRHAEAIEAMDKAIEKYRDLPDVVDELRTFKLRELARVPGTRDAARKLALDIAADYWKKNDSGFAADLMSHYEAAVPENKDKDFVWLALSLLQETPIPSNDTDAEYELLLRRDYYSALAKAYDLLDRTEDAKTSLQQALSLAEALVLHRRERGAHELNIKIAARILAQLQERMAALNERPTKAEQVREPEPPSGSN